MNLRLVPLVAVTSALLCAWVSLSVLGAYPHVQDEAAYLFQARLLASGRLWAEAHPLGTLVPFTAVDAAGRWFGLFPDGWPLVLAIGVALGERLGRAGDLLPFLVNPALTGLAVWRAGGLAARLGERDGLNPGVAGLASASLLGFSPQVVLLGGSLMSHSLVLLCVIRAMEVGDREVRGAPDTRRGLAGFVEAGLWIGLCAWARPVCGAALGLGLVLWRPAWGWGLAALVSCGPVGLQLGHNQLLTGDLRVWPSDLYNQLLRPDRPGCAALGFGPDRGCARGFTGHTPEAALSSTLQNLRAWGWLLPGPLVLLGLGSGPGRRLLCQSFAFSAGIIGVYALYWYAGTCYGARFYHAAVPPLLLAAGLGVAGLGDRARLVLAGAFALQLGALSRALPELVNYWAMDDRFVAMERDWTRPPAVVLVQDMGSPLNLDYPITGVSGQSIGALTRYASHVRPESNPLLLLGQASPHNLAVARTLSRPIYVVQMFTDPNEDRLLPVEPQVGVTDP